MTADPLELAVERHIAASPDAVYRVWTERLPEWWAPLPWRTELDELDLRPGGRFATVMYGPGGERMPNEGVILEVVRGARIVTTDAYHAGWRPARPFMTAIFTFAPDGAGTRYRAAARHWDEVAAEKHRQMGFVTGWGQVAAQLAALLESGH